MAASSMRVFPGVQCWLLGNRGQQIVQLEEIVQPDKPSCIYKSLKSGVHNHGAFRTAWFAGRKRLYTSSLPVRIDNVPPDGAVLDHDEFTTHYLQRCRKQRSCKVSLVIDVRHCWRCTSFSKNTILYRKNQPAPASQSVGT